MNFKTRPFIQSIFVIFAIIIALVVWDYFHQQIPENLSGTMDAFLSYSVLALVMVAGIGVAGFLFYNLIREIFTESVMQRAEEIRTTALDKNGEYLYISVSCYQSGDESTPGFYIYKHYLFNLASGEKHVHEAGKAYGEEQKAIEYLNNTLKKSLEFSLCKPPLFHFEKENYKVKINGFKSRFDFGFKIVCYDKKTGQILWSGSV